jgi:DNA invertase Pin-like site-specific DNA recombinase
VAYALARIAAGEARALVISDLRTLCRSIVDLGSLVHRLTRARAALIALDLDIDTTTSDGRAGAEAVMTLAGWEHDRIARRTRTGIDRARARGRPIGPPAVSDAPAVRERVAAMRAANMTLQAIADTLNAEGVPTMRGGARWRPSSVQTVLGYRRPTRSR